MTYTTLITADQLRALIAQAGDLVIVDAGFDLADTAAGERQYREGHVPGAHFAHLDRDLCAPMTGSNGRHPLPSREAFAARAGAWGIGPATQVIVYDRQQAMFAAHAWWMLRWLGHEAVAVLDGGIVAWRGAGEPLQTSVPTPSARGPYPLRAPLVATVDATQLAAQLGRVRLLDARAPERYRGDVEPLDKQAGHIPGATNRFFKNNLAADGRFKPPDALRQEFAPLVAGHAAAQVVHHCGSGVTACHNLFAMELAGLHGSALYPGSWSEWSSDPSRPVARS
jgi:thiosulfate/3-mercaptopyruvate sulfurtransferase